MSYACAVKENGMPATVPAIAAQSAVWFAKCACTRSARTAASQRAAARAFGVTARSRACDQGFFPAARCSAPRVRRTAMGRASSIRRAPARIPVSTSAGVNTPAGRRRANVPCRSAVAPRYSGTMNTSCPASWTSIISFTTNGCEGAGGKAGITYAMRMPASHPSGRRASRDGGLPAGVRENAGSDRERRAAAAGVRGLRVRELEAAAVEARHEVDLGADEVLGAARIDQDPDPVVLEHLVALARLLVEAELVAEPRAPAPNHRDPERVRLREPLLRPHLLHHLDRPGREDERRAGLLVHARTIETQPRKVNAVRRAAPAGQRSWPILPIVRHCETPPGGSACQRRGNARPTGTSNDVRPATGTALCYDVLSGAVQRKAIVPPLALPDPRTAQALIIAPVLIQRELRGHAIVIREAQRKFTRDELEFLLLLVGQAAAGFENVRLQEKAEEYAVAEERGRIARDLHDGFIQSLAGIDLKTHLTNIFQKLGVRDRVGLVMFALRHGLTRAA